MFRCRNSRPPDSRRPRVSARILAPAARWQGGEEPSGQSSAALAFDNHRRPCPLESVSRRRGWRRRRRWRVRVIAQIDRIGRHRGGDGVLVDDLLLAFPLQQQAECVKSDDDALQTDAVAEENRDRGLSAQEMIVKDILQSVDIVLGHFLSRLSDHDDCRQQTRQDDDGILRDASRPRRQGQHSCPSFIPN